MSQQKGAILLPALGGMGQRQLSIFLYFFLASAFAFSEVQNRKIFPSIFKKIPPARKKEKEGKFCGF
jgi:hypothetical protein